MINAEKRKYFILLLLSSMILPFSFTQAEEVYRGPEYIDTALPDGRHTWITAPLWIFDGQQYVPYIYEDRYFSDGYFQMQNSLIGVRIYDYYAEFYSPDMDEVRLYDERWEVQIWTGKKWNDVGAQSGSPSFQTSQSENGVTITKSFNSWAGELTISYILREGQPLKHTVYFHSILLDKTTYRGVQKWAGIVGNQVLHEYETDTITAPTVINGTFFKFLKSDDSLSIFENQFKAIEYLQPVIVDTHAQGMKADFIFSNWTLAQGETLEIDPDTATLTPPLADSYVKENFPSNNYGTSTTMVIHEGAADEWWTLCKWNITSLSGYYISSAETRYYLSSKSGITDPAYQRRITSSWTEGAVKWDNRPSSTATGQVQFSIDSPDYEDSWKIIDATDIVKSWIEDGTTNYGVLCLSYLEGNGQGSFHTKDWVGGNAPVLYVEYIPASYIIITSLSASSLNVPINTNVEMRATAELDTGHGLGSGDWFVISGMNFTYDASDSRFEYIVVSSTAQTITYDSFDSGYEATFTVTTGIMNGTSVSVTWYSSPEGSGGSGGGSSGVAPPPGPSEPPLIITPSWWMENGAFVIAILLIGSIVYGQMNKPSEQEARNKILGGITFNPNDVRESLVEFGEKVKKDVWDR